jgi:hypothetical protein
MTFFPPTTCFVHRVDARPTVFRDGDLEPHIKLESQVNEVFFYQTMYFLNAKKSAAAAIAAAEKLMEKRRIFVH